MTEELCVLVSCMRQFSLMLTEEVLTVWSNIENELENQDHVFTASCGSFEPADENQLPASANVH